MCKINFNKILIKKKVRVFVLEYFNIVLGDTEPEREKKSGDENRVNNRWNRFLFIFVD